MSGLFGTVGYLITVALLVIPLLKLLPRYQLNPMLAAICVFPPLAFIPLWMMAAKERS